MLQHVLLALQIALAWFGGLSACAALVFVAARHAAHASLRKRHSSNGALVLRLLPAGLSVAIVALVVVPAYAWLEPFGSAARGERLGLTGTALAITGAALLLASAGRGLRACLASRRRMRTLYASASRLPALDSPMPVFVTDSPTACVVLDGLLKPRLVVSRSVLERLSPEEFDRAAAHELAHHRAQDNLKRRLLAFAPDLVSGTQLARELERAWKQAAELEADASAAGVEQSDALALASALVKVARLAQTHPRIDFGRAAFHDGAPVAERIRRLCGRSSSPVRPDRSTRRLPALVALCLLPVALANVAAVLTAAHRITEWLVHLP
jgi:Zn-dependent protease with chaperone function